MVNEYVFQSVIDIGSGRGLQADFFRNHGKKVTKLDLGRSARAEIRGDEMIGDFLTMNVRETYDLVWASHVLEHQPDTTHAIKKFFEFCSPTGTVAITVPPAKPEFV